jgi:hypothetical protein
MHALADSFLDLLPEHSRRSRIHKCGVSLQIQAINPFARRGQNQFVFTPAPLPPRANCRLRISDCGFRISLRIPHSAFRNGFIPHSATGFSPFRNRLFPIPQSAFRNPQLTLPPRPPGPIVDCGFRIADFGFHSAFRIPQWVHSAFRNRLFPIPQSAFPHSAICIPQSAIGTFRNPHSAIRN